MNQTIPSVPPGWQMLARGEQENDQVTRCPAGHIHLDYGNFTVRLHRDEFLTFARMVAEAAARLQGVAWSASTFERPPGIGFSEN